MAIKINNNTVIDDSQNITNIGDITASGTVNGGIIATTAEAQAGSSDSVIMTPLKVKEAIQGGTISVIKSVQRFTVSYPAGSIRLSLTAGVTISSSPGGATISSPGAPGDYTFINLPTAVNINKSFLTVTVSGVAQNSNFGFGTGVPGEVNIGARLYNSSGGYAGDQVQLTSNIGSNFIYNTDGLQILVEVVEFY